MVKLGNEPSAPHSRRCRVSLDRSNTELDRGEQGLVASLACTMPADERIVGNAWDGAAITGPLAGGARR